MYDPLLQTIAQVEMYDREHQARKNSLEDNVTDMIVHQTASSDPVVRSFDKQVKHCKGPALWSCLK